MALDSPDALDLESGLGFSGGDEDKPNIVGNPAALEKARSRKRRRSQREKADDSAEHAGEGKRKKKRKRKQRNAESKAESSVSSGKLKKAPASAKAKAKRRAGAGSRKGGKMPRTSADEKWRKCPSCKKHKDSKLDYHADQSKCRKCVSDLRSFKRACETQKCEERMATIAKEDPSLHERAVKQFVKEREKASALGERLKFSIVEFVVSIKKSEGQRVEEKGRMMWKTWYLEWAQSTKGGGLSEGEAKDQGREMEADSSVIRDQRGPRNHLRLCVPRYTDIMDYDNLARSRELSKGEKLSQKQLQDEKVMSGRLQLLGSGGSSLDHFADAWDGKDGMEARLKANNLAASSLEPCIDDLANREVSKKRLSGASSSRPAASSDSGSGYSSDEYTQDSKDIS